MPGKGFIPLKGAAMKQGSRLMPQAAFHRQRVRGRDDPKENRGRPFHFVISNHLQLNYLTHFHYFFSYLPLRLQPNENEY
jgi:hypothetical protein